MSRKPPTLIFSDKASEVLALVELRQLYGKAQEAFWQVIDETPYADAYRVAKLFEQIDAECRVFFGNLNTKVAREIEEVISETPSKRP